MGIQTGYSFRKEFIGYYYNTYQPGIGFTIGNNIWHQMIFGIFYSFWNELGADSVTCGNPGNSFYIIHYIIIEKDHEIDYLVLIALIPSCKSPENITVTETLIMTSCNEESARQAVLKRIKSVNPSLNINELVVKTEKWEKNSVFFFSVKTDSTGLVVKGYISIVNMNNCEIIEFKRTL